VSCFTGDFRSGFVIASEELRLGRGEACGCEDAFVEGDEETFAASKDGAVGALKFGLVEEFAVEGAVGLSGAV
jgi:hypothetical protein